MDPTQHSHHPDSPADAEAPGGEILDLGPRHEDMGPIGAGGMGQVRRVRDLDLDRVLAMKILRNELGANDDARSRFVTEARITARLSHPGIVPVHEVGQLPDGRTFYTMREVTGHTLSEAITTLHETGQKQSSAVSRDLAALVQALRQVCEAVAFAHERRVVHGDLKPDNVVLGDHGAVYVVDWGLARSLGTSLAASDGDERMLAGTPAYMAPERVWGTAQDERAGDVYALGAMLYELLAGIPPYGKGSPVEILQRVAAGPPDPLDETTLRSGAAPPPAELVRLCAAAMRREPELRPPDAAVLGRSLADWLEGRRRRERALELVAEADGVAAELDQIHRAAGRHLRQAHEVRAGLGPGAAVDQLRPAWNAEDAADQLFRAAARLEARHTSLLHGALSTYPDLPEANAALAAVHRARHARAEADGDERKAEHEMTLLRVHDRTGAHRAYVRGDGALSLRTDVPGVRVRLLRNEVVDRRLVPQLVDDNLTGPLDEHPLPAGSYLVEIVAPGRTMVTYPVTIDRLGHWDGVPPDGSEPAVIPLPPLDALAPDEAYVPPGWFRAGGDAAVPGSLAAVRVWLDGFVIGRNHITHANLLLYLAALIEAGDEDRALRDVPRLTVAPSRSTGEPIYGRDGDGRFTLDGGPPGLNLAPDHPAVWITWAAAASYARWRSTREGHPWQLPGELQWEKACRGVDGRPYPWGRHLDPTACNMRDSRAGGARIGPVAEFADDRSPYGVHDLAGNVRDWCLDRWRPDGPPLRDGRWIPEPASAGDARVGRGGAWCVNPVASRAAYRAWYSADFGGDDSLGLRLVRPYPSPVEHRS